MQASPQTLLEHIPHPKETSHAPCLLLPPALISFLSPRICPIWGFHEMKADHMGSFWVWLLSLSITFPKLYPWCTLDAHGVPFSWPSNTPPLSHARSFIHSTADGRLCSFHVLALLSHVAVAMPVPGFVCVWVSFPGWIPGSGVTRPQGTSVTFEEPAGCFPRCQLHLPVPPQCVGSQPHWCSLPSVSLLMSLLGCDAASRLRGF